MVWAAVSAIFRLQHVFVAVERFFPVVTPPSDMSLPVFIAKFPLLMVLCRPTFRLCSDLFLACWRPDGAPAVGNAKVQDKKSVQRGRAVLGRSRAAEGCVLRCFSPEPKQCHLNRLTGQVARRRGRAGDKQRKRCAERRDGCNEMVSWPRAWRAGSNEKALQWKAFVTAT